jgi:hypothetical protein
MPLENSLPGSHCTSTVDLVVPTGQIAVIGVPQIAFTWHGLVLDTGCQIPANFSAPFSVSATDTSGVEELS